MSSPWSEGSNAGGLLEGVYLGAAESARPIACSGPLLLLTGVHLDL